MEISTDKSYIGFWGIFVITLAGIANAISLALMSSAGYACIIIFIIAGIFFYIPSALVSTELATNFPSEKGIYDWVTQAFGPKAGSLTVWCQNIGPVISMPVLLSFTISCLAYGIDQDWLTSNKYYIIIGCIVVVWLMVCINLTGLKSSVKAAAIASLFIYIIPISLFAIFSIYWLVSGQPIATPLSSNNIFAQGGIFSNVSLLVVAIFMLSGIAQPAYFANLVRKPSTYTKAMILASVILLLAPLLGCFGILLVQPVHQLNDQTGVMNALSVYFTTLFGSEVGIWLDRLVMWMFFLGQMCVVSTIFLIASRGMMALSISGMLPKSMSYANERNVCTSSMIWLGIISTLCILAYALIPSLTVAFAVISVIFSIAGAAQYLFLFAAYIKLKKVESNASSGAFKIKNKFIAIFYCVGLGGLCTIIAILFSFIPSSDSSGMSLFTYEMIIIIGCIIIFLLPYVILKLNHNRAKSI